jgi:hypothetical protein
LSIVCELLSEPICASRRKKVNVNGGKGNAADLEEFIEIELSRTLGCLILAMNDRLTGKVAAANRGELGAHRAYQEALRLFRVLRHHIGQTAARRLAVRIKKIDSAMQEG